MESKTRVLIAKPGIDGHERGARLIAGVLRDAGMEVIYLGLHRTREEIVSTAIEEDVDVVGLSIHGGSHLFETEKLVKLLRERGSQQKVVIGGFIPQEDVDKLKALGVSAVFRTNTPLNEIVEYMKSVARPPAQSR
jgi:methylmalonyl-CoA mutase C-terminal domain/subunit